MIDRSSLEALWKAVDLLENAAGERAESKEKMRGMGLNDQDLWKLLDVMSDCDGRIIRARKQILESVHDFSDAVRRYCA